VARVFAIDKPATWRHGEQSARRGVAIRGRKIGVNGWESTMAGGLRPRRETGRRRSGRMGGAAAGDCPGADAGGGKGFLIFS